MMWRSLKMPGSPSSQLTTRYFGAVNFRALSHLIAAGKYAPPRPRSPDSLTSSVTASGVVQSAFARPAYPPRSRYSSSETGSTSPTPSSTTRVWPAKKASAGFLSGRELAA